MILLSGGFDPLHPGHIEMIRQAAEYGDVYIALNSDGWLHRKKGFVFQTWMDRAHILRALRWVESVEPVFDEDGTVCEAIETLKPEYFGNGGDRTAKNIPELDLCEKMGVKAVFGLGGEKFASSSYICSRNHVERNWGHYVLLDEGLNYKVKRLIVDPKKSTSRQRHEKREEFWIEPLTGNVCHIPKGEWHQLENPNGEEMTVIEVQTGVCEESDIERI